MVPPQLVEVGTPRIAALRAEYLAELPEAQEAFLEMLMHSAAHYLILWRNEEVGYVSVHDGATAIEFHLIAEALSFAQDLFPPIVGILKLERAWIKTFDHLFLSCALDCQNSVSTKGLLVREYIRRVLPEIARIVYKRRVATGADLEAILKVRQDVFTNSARLTTALRSGNVHVFHRETELVGFCIIRRILEGRPDVDIGIAVDTPFRNKGYAVYMLRDMVEYAIDHGLHPVTGCEQSNTASFRLGRRIGFVARHRLIETRFGARAP